MKLNLRFVSWCGGIGIALLAAGCGPRMAAAPAAGAFPQSPPPPLSERRIEFPGFRETTLPNGLRLIVVEHRSQPLVSVNLYVGAGAAQDPVERAGLAGMTADLLTKGTPGRTATEIAEQIEYVGGTLNAAAGVDWLTLSSSVLAEHLPLAMELVSESAIRPTFPESEVELTRRRTLSALQSALGQPGQIARRTFDREVYGQGHPYGIAPIPGSVQAVARTEIQNFHQRYFNAANALLVVAGDVSAEQVEALARQRFGDWRSGERARIDFPAARERGGTRISLVHRPGSAQTNILIGHLAFRPDDPEFFALQVMNSIIGGHADARLFQILREQRGWTYGSYSRFTRPREVGYFEASAEVRPEVTDSALVEMLTQLRRIQSETVTREELEANKGFLAGSFPLRIETAGQIASQIATIRLLGLPIENLTQYRERIQAVTAADVQRVARQYIRPDAAVVVVVGDARELAPRLRGIAPVDVYDTEGQALDLATLD
jgi:zinc protease